MICGELENTISTNNAWIWSFAINIESYPLCPDVESVSSGCRIMGSFWRYIQAPQKLPTNSTILLTKIGE